MFLEIRSRGPIGVGVAFDSGLETTDTFKTRLLLAPTRRIAVELLKLAAVVIGECLDIGLEELIYAGRPFCLHII